MPEAFERGDSLDGLLKNSGVFQEIDEISGKPGGGGAIDNVMIEGDGQVQVIAHANHAIMNAGFLGDPADGQTQGVNGEKSQPPTPAFAKHADRSEHHRAFDAFQPMGIFLKHPKEEQAEETRGTYAQVKQQTALLAGPWIGLDAANLGADLARRPAFRTVDDMGDCHRARLRLDHGDYIDLSKDNQTAAPIAVGLNHGDRFNSPGKAGDNKSRK